MISFFLNKKYPVYKAEYLSDGAGETVEWSIREVIKACVEPYSGENLFKTELGDVEKFSLQIYSKSELYAGDRIYLNGVWYEIRHREFYSMPFINYWKGYLIKTDENIRI